MRIDRLIVKRTKPSETIIRNVKFNTHGLSLIVDNTLNTSSDSGNNVGKTTVIKIIDLCLGAQSVRDLYFDSDTRSENKDIKDFLSKGKVQAELILIDDDDNQVSIRRDLFLNGRKAINNIELSKDEFWLELKKLLFNFKEDNPTFRQLISKFVRVSSVSAESMIKFLPGMTTYDIYDAIYSFLFQLLRNDLVSRRKSLSTKLSECQKVITILEKNESIKSLGVLRQKKEIIESDLTDLEKKRKNLSYIEEYREELEEKRKLTSRISELEEMVQFLDFEIATIDDSVKKLANEKSQIDTSVINSIYEEARLYLPNLSKKFEDVIAFHNAMIQNRMDFIAQSRSAKQDKLDKTSAELDELLETKKLMTIEMLDEGLLDDLNHLNKKLKCYQNKKER